MSSNYLKEIPKRNSQFTVKDDEINSPSLTNENNLNIRRNNSINEYSQQSQNIKPGKENLQNISPIEFGPFNAMQNLNIAKIQESNKMLEFEKERA